MNEQRHNLFSELIARHQSELYAYIFAIVRNWEDADDLFQSLCLTLWRKFDAFEPGTSFMAWARQSAKYETLKFLTRKRPAQSGSEELIDELSVAAVSVVNEDAELHLAALDRCREKLDAADRKLLELHYAEDLGSRQIAESLHRSQSSVCNSLNRIRCWLLECIQREISQQDHPGGQQP
jgi:RNA polymerase sigma-70 factor, ECF subfamily